MAEDQNEPGVESANKPTPDNNVSKSLVNSEDEAEKKEFEEVDKAMDEIAKFVDQFNEKDSTKVEPKISDAKESPVEPVEDDLESNQSIKLVLEDSEESKDLRPDDRDEAEEKTKSDPEVEETITNNTNEDELKKSKPNDENVQKPDEIKTVTEDSAKAESKLDRKEDLKKIESLTEKEKPEDKPPLEKIIIKINKKSDNDVILESSIKNSKPVEKCSVSKTEKKENPLRLVAIIKKAQPKSKKDVPTEPEVGIVGPPAAASEVLSEAELAVEKPSLPTDETKPAAGVSDRVVQWVEKTAAKTNDPIPIEEEPQADIEEIHQTAPKECEVRKKRGRKRKVENDGTTGAEGPTVPRKAQKVVSNIIRRSIRW